MFTKITTTFTTLAILAVATTAAPQAVGGAQQCSTGQIQCCQSVQQASSEPITTILGLLGLLLEDLNLLVGLTCDPISVVGIGAGNACSAHTVCCEDNSTGGLISIGCLPISL
ncbi:fungal hydrophobin-domain-containing protein [Trametes polyzona]|nr:fungal hydrophobin-domain-containing protein [Trametes polyzona]